MNALPVRTVRRGPKHSSIRPARKGTTAPLARCQPLPTLVPWEHLVTLWVHNHSMRARPARPGSIVLIRVSLRLLAIALADTTARAAHKARSLRATVLPQPVAPAWPVSTARQGRQRLWPARLESTAPLIVLIKSQGCAPVATIARARIQALGPASLSTAVCAPSAHTANLVQPRQSTVHPVHLGLPMCSRRLRRASSAQRARIVPWPVLPMPQAHATRATFALAVSPRRARPSIGARRERTALPGLPTRYHVLLASTNPPQARPPAWPARQATTAQRSTSHWPITASTPVQRATTAPSAPLTQVPTHVLWARSATPQSLCRRAIAPPAHPVCTARPLDRLRHKACARAVPFVQAVRPWPHRQTLTLKAATPALPATIVNQVASPPARARQAHLVFRPASRPKLSAPPVLQASTVPRPVKRNRQVAVMLATFALVVRR